MSTTETRHSWESVHSDYLAFAVSACRAAQAARPVSEPKPHLDRNVVDTVRYSYDCLEASVEFTYHMGGLDQLPIPIPPNWLTRYVVRNWGNLSLSDRIGILAHAWRQSDFWVKDEHFRLFREWKKVRDGLTHPVPFGTKLEREILERRQFEDEATVTVSRIRGKPERIGAESMSFRPGDTLADFSPDPTSLEKGDAVKALEILLLHLARLEDLFFRGRTSQFAYHEVETNRLLTTVELLGTIQRSFADTWETP